MPGNAPIQSVQRAARLLHAIAGAEDGLSVAQAAAAAGLRLHTAYKFLRTLESENLLQRREHPLRFLLGRGISELKRLDDDRHLLTLGGRLLVRAQARLPSASLVLLEPDGPDTYQRLGVFSDRPGVLVKRRDFKVDPYAKASSLLFLAHASPETTAAFFQKHPFVKTGRALWKSRARLEAFLEKIRHEGLALPEFPDSTASATPLFRLAVPVFAADASLVACIAGFLPDTASRTAKKQLVTLCRSTAAELTKRLSSRSAAS
jgi:DNA-binding IclR family transcriptional regulator